MLTEKTKFAISSVSIFSIIIIGLVVVFFLPKESPFNSASALIMLFNILIISSWLYCGNIVGVISSLLSIFFIILAMWSLAERNLGFYIILIGAVSIIMYRFYAQSADSIRGNNVQVEKLQLEINEKGIELKEKRQEILSLKNRFEKFSNLKNLTYELSATILLDEIDRIITERSFGLVGKAESALLYLVDQEKQEIFLAHSQFLKEGARIKFKKGDIFDIWVFKQRTPLLVEDIDKDFRFDPEKIKELNRDFKSLISIPLISQERLLGILRMESRRQSNFNQEDLRLLDVLGTIGAFALENAILYKKTEELAIKDGLTGLYVHRYFHKRLSEEIARANFENSQFSLLMLDIDDFKDYNDKYGHPAGDIVLRNIADTIGKIVKDESGLTARYGGEEFAVVLLNKQKQEALKIAEKIREKIATQTFILRRQPTFITVSIGVVSFPEDGRLKDELIKKADALLYKAKKEGKNRVCYQ